MKRVLFLSLAFVGLAVSTPAADHSTYPALSATGLNVAMFWTDSSTLPIRFRRSTDGANSWLTTLGWDSPTGISDDPALALAGTYVYRTWMNNSSGNYDIDFAASPDNGLSWPTKAVLCTNAGASLHPAVAASGAFVYVAWSDGTTGRAAIYFRRSADHGATWGTTQYLSDPYPNINWTDAYDPALAASGANVYVAWHDTGAPHDDILFRRSSTYGQTWGAAKNLSSNAGVSTEVSLTAAGSKVFAAWSDAAPGNPEVFIRKSGDGGGTWNAVKNLSKSAGVSENPKVAVSGTYAYVVWDDDTTGRPEIYFRRSADGGGTWQAAQRRTIRNAISQFPALAVSQGNIYLLYWAENGYSNGVPLMYGFFQKSTNRGLNWTSENLLIN